MPPPADVPRGDKAATSSSGANDASKKAAMAAAMAAVKYAAPGNRERVMNEAMSAALDPSSVKPNVVGNAADKPTTTAKRARTIEAVEELGTAVIESGMYQPPDWGESYPLEDEVSLDVMRTGTILDAIPLPSPQGRTFITFGRNKQADVIVEHPSASRLHAVLQFRGRAAYLCDCGSTHRTFLNQAELEAGKYYAVHVGAQFRLGQSTRSYILAAPEEWQAPEGPNREERRRRRREAAARAHVAAAAANDRRAAEAAMQEALHGEARWGMGLDDSDAVARGDDGNDDDEDVDWRPRYDAGLLTQKQTKIADTIRAKEYKMQRMQEDSRRIRAKEGDGNELTPGQAAALLNNEKGADKLRDEVQELEETLQDSLKDSRDGKRAAAAAAPDARAEAKRRRRARADDSDSGDEFFDRTIKKDAQAGAKDAAAAHTVESLCKRRAEHRAEAAELEAKIAKMFESIQAAASAGAAGGSEALEEVMQGLAQQDLKVESKRLELQLRLTREQLAQVEQLIAIADPHGEYQKRFMQ